VVNGAPVAPDPIRERRARIARLVKLGTRIGYGALLLAMVAFGIGLATDFADVWVTVTIVGLVVAIVVLPVPIVLGYGIRAAEREEREQGYR
jgi:hypothetical protein